MWPSDNMSARVGGKLYRVETATLLAHNRYWDGSNMERGGRNRFLYRTPRGNYFFVYMTMWQGETDYIDPCSIDDAMDFWTRQSSVREVEAFESAFPGVETEEA